MCLSCICIFSVFVVCLGDLFGLEDLCPADSFGSKSDRSVLYWLRFLSALFAIIAVCVSPEFTFLLSSRCPCVALPLCRIACV